MSFKEQIDLERIPQHVAIIMDGNGRWAEERGFERNFGHQSGILPVRECTEAATELGIKYLTLYAFSTENWSRPQKEIDRLMELLIETMEKEIHELNKNNIRLIAIGDLTRLKKEDHDKLANCIESTKSNTRMNLVVALSYSSRWEIINAVKHITQEVVDGKIKIEDINDKLFSESLTTQGIPDPDLMIRTSGELRISNFLLWQIAYSELYFPKIYWPDFRKENFHEAIVEYQKRERRFGK